MKMLFAFLAKWTVDEALVDIELTYKHTALKFCFFNKCSDENLEMNINISRHKLILAMLPSEEFTFLF